MVIYHCLLKYCFYLILLSYLCRTSNYPYLDLLGFPHSSVGKSSTYSAGDLGSIPGLGRSPGEGNGNPLQYSCLENPMDRGAWRATYSPWGRKRVRHNLATKPPELFRSKIQSISVMGLWSFITHIPLFCLSALFLSVLSSSSHFPPSGV